MKIKLPDDRFPYVFSAIYFLFNSFFISKVLAVTHDSIYYYYEIINRPDLLFPHHLLFTPFMSEVSKLIFVLGINSDIVALSLINTTAGSIIIIIIYKLLTNNLGFTRIVSRFTILFCAFSFSFWFYNLNIETYHLPLVFVFTSIYFLTKSQRGKFDIILSALFGGIAVLFHQLHGLFGLVAVIFLTLNGFKKNIRQIFIFTIIFNAVWLLGYSLAIYSIGLTSFDEIKRWFFLYNYEMEGWSRFGISFFILPVIGFLRSFVSIHGLFIDDNLSSFLFAKFTDNNLEDDAFIVRNLTDVDFIIYTVLIIVFAVLMIYMIRPSFTKTREYFLKLNNLKIIYIFLIIYSVFFIFWAPINLEFWIPQSLAFWIILAAPFNYVPADNKFKMIAWLIIVLLFFINFRYTILFTRDISNDLYYIEVSDAVNKLPAKSLVLYDSGWIISKYYEIYAPQINFMSLGTTEFSEKKLLSLIEHKGEVFVKRSLLENNGLTDNAIYTVSEIIQLGNTDFIRLIIE